MEKEGEVEVVSVVDSPNGATNSSSSSGRRRKAAALSDSRDKSAGRKRYLRSGVAKQKGAEAEGAEKRAPEEEFTALNRDEEILRSNFAKQKETKAEEVEKKAPEEVFAALKRDEDLSNGNGVDRIVYEDGLKVEEKNVPKKRGRGRPRKLVKDATVSNRVGIGMQLVESKSSVSSEVTQKSESGEIHVKKSAEEVAVEIAAGLHQNGHKSVFSDGKVIKEKRSVHANRRLTRSNTAKLIAEADTRKVVEDNTDKRRHEEFVSSEAAQHSNGTINIDEAVEVHKTIVGSKVQNKMVTRGKTKVGEWALQLAVAKQRDEADINMNLKKVMESVLGKRRSKQASGAGSKWNINKTDLSRFEGKKLKTGFLKDHHSGRKQTVPTRAQEDGSSYNRTSKRRSWPEDEKNKQGKYLEQMMFKKLKHNDGSPAGVRKVNFSSSRGNLIKAIVTQRGSRKGDKVTSECSHLTPAQEKKAKGIELSEARKKLRDQIKSMLLNAGWEIDLRQRKGHHCKDAVYISPNRCTHWSILKAYDAFQKQFSDDLSKESPQTSCLSFTPIPLEALSILRHPISRRRSYREIAEAKRNLGDDSKSNMVLRFSTAKLHQKKNGKQRGRPKQASIAGSRAKGSVKSTGKPQRGKYRKKQKGCALLVRSFNRRVQAGSDSYVPYAWKRTILSWMIDVGVMCENSTVKYMNKRQTKALLTGQITRDGIHCTCCSKIFTVSEFEIHAGSKQCKPYQNIILEEAGSSLSQCLITAWEKQDESERMGFHLVDVREEDPSDDTCGTCGDGGDLICCDGCPSTFHQSCLGAEMLPPGDWYCMNCSCRFCKLNSGIVAEAAAEMDPMLTCSQCEEKYHQSCVPEEEALPVNTNGLCISFCSLYCKKLFENLRMLLGLKNYIDAEFSYSIVQRVDNDLPELAYSLDQRAECNSMIAVAHAVMDECFMPIIDKRSGINLIHNVVYNCGSNFTRLNYRGFYTFILQRGDEIISVASVRIHGPGVAEMPFIGTRNMYRRQGMCRRLLNEIESVLRSLNIEKLIIPAIAELMDTWTNVFGFKLLEIAQKEEIRFINLLMFPGTGVLVKPLLEKDSVNSKPSDTVEQLEPESMFHHTHEKANDVFKPTDLEPEVHVSDTVIEQHKLEIENLDPSFSVSRSCMKVHSDVSVDLSDANKFKSEASEFKSSENSVETDLPLQHEAVSPHELLNRVLDGDNTVHLSSRLI